ncbi:MAG: cytochrome-c oxidase, cbb3-type subunit II, partial [Bacteroidota bacterium]|nr:cytochrome-c oxidase, cbb3-type subunit II [Bacteroidota bacterium]
AIKGDVHEGEKEHWHRWIERHPIQLTIWSAVAILVGSVIELIPTLMVKSNVPTIESVKPYTALELEGRDLYIREGCNACHSQMIRPFRSETARYGEYAKAGEFVYDHPHLWGSKRTGPDLLRVGGKYPHSWHYNHMLDPKTMSPGSIMPRYSHMFSLDGNDATLDVSDTEAKLKAMQKLGVPYSDEYVANWEKHLTDQAQNIATELNQDPNIEVGAEEEIVALIAYLQRLGTDIKKSNQDAIVAEK